MHSKQKARILELFRKIDVDGDSNISENEFTKVLVACGCPERASREVFKAADMDENGSLDYEEFLNWVFTDRAPPISMLAKETDRRDANDKKKEAEAERWQPEEVGEAEEIQDESTDNKSIQVLMNSLEAEEEELRRVAKELSKACTEASGDVLKLALQTSQEDPISCGFFVDVWMVVSTPLKSREDQCLMTELQRLKAKYTNVILAYDWPNSPNSRKSDLDLWDEADSLRKPFIAAHMSCDSEAFVSYRRCIFRTLWFHLYSGMVKGYIRCVMQADDTIATVFSAFNKKVKLKLRLKCVMIEGGPVSRCEAHSMPYLVHDALAELQHTKPDTDISDVRIIRCPTLKSFEDCLEHGRCARPAVEKTVDAKVVDDIREEMMVLDQRAGNFGVKRRLYEELERRQMKITELERRLLQRDKPGLSAADPMREADAALDKDYLDPCEASAKLRKDLSEAWIKESGKKFSTIAPNSVLIIVQVARRCPELKCVLSAVALLLGYSEKDAEDCDALEKMILGTLTMKIVGPGEKGDPGMGNKKMIADKNFQKKITKLKPSSVTSDTLQKLDKYTGNDSFTPERVVEAAICIASAFRAGGEAEREAMACRAMCEWVLAIRKFAEEQ